MQIHKGFESFQSNKKTTVTTGTFDGVHLGHSKILNQLIKVGKETHTETVLFTFLSHPRTVLFPDSNLKVINSLEENISLFQSFNIDHLIIHDFDKKFSRITSLEYIRDILVKKINMNNLIIGFNHNFGRNREGSFNELVEYEELFNFKIHKVEAHFINQKSISSTKIRDAINKGLVDLANNYLGYNFTIHGKVIKGRGRGRDLGFPTANLLLKKNNKIIPLKGVYIVNVIFKGDIYQGMINIGNNPTFDSAKPSIEVHIFKFNQNIYNEYLEVQFIKRIRSEKKFSSVEELKRQLSIDKIYALSHFN